MNNQLRQIKVFISSKCGGKYSSVRKTLSKLLNATTIFSAYIFEDEGASPIPLQEKYLGELRDSDVCIFIIDNEDGISDPVMNEIRAAKAYEKRSFFYFFKGKSESRNELQDELTTLGNCVFQSNIPCFEDIPRMAYEDLQKNVLDVYIRWCNNIYIEDSSVVDSVSVGRETMLSNTSITKHTFINLNKCEQFFIKFILGKSEETASGGRLDDACYNLLERLLESGKVEDFPYITLLEAAKENATGYYDANLIGERWKYVKAYYDGDFSLAKKYAEGALAKGNEIGAPDWLIDDLLIDLRNLDFYQSPITFQYQEELKKRETVLVYPVIDRVEADLYRDLIKTGEDSRSDSIYTERFGSNIISLVRHLTKIFVLAAMYGSLTYLTSMLDQLHQLAFHMCEQYNNLIFRTLLLKLSIAKGDDKKVEKVLKAFNGTELDFNPSKAQEIFEFTKNCSLPTRRHAAIFAAFRHVGCYMSDQDFRNAMYEFSTYATQVINKPEKYTNAGKPLFSAIQVNGQRLDIDWVAMTCKKGIDTCRSTWMNNALLAIKGSINGLEELPDCVSTELLEAVRVTLEADKNFCGYSAVDVLVCLSKMDGLKNDCDKLAQELLEGDLQSTYEIMSAPDEELTDLLTLHVEPYIAYIERGNKTQGVNNTYSFGLKAEYENVGIYIENADNPDIAVCHKAAKAASGTIAAPRQTLKAKVDACILLMRLAGKIGVSSINAASDVSSQLSNADPTESANLELCGKNTQTGYAFCLDATSFVFGLCNERTILYRIPYFYSADPFEQAQMGRTLSVMVHAISEKKFTPSLVEAIYSSACFLTSSERFEVRLEGFDLFNELLDKNILVEVISKWLIGMYEGGTPNEKCRIIHMLNNTLNDSSAVITELKNKALNDCCYISRHLAEECFGE